MLDRRTTLKLGASSILASLVNLPGQSLANSSSKSANTHLLHSHVLFDSQYLESQSFAAAVKAKGTPITDINGNLSNLWYQQLRHQLLSDRKPLLGMTSRLDLFCLEELARDVGMKVHLRFDHLIHQNGRVEHQMNGSSFVELGSKAGFGKKMAELADLSLSHQTAEITVQKLTGPFTPSDKTALVTWVIS